MVRIVRGHARKGPRPVTGPIEEYRALRDYQSEASSISRAIKPFPPGERRIAPVAILLNADRSDFLAFFGASFTGIGAFLAMCHIVFPAFFATFATNLGTETTDFLRELG